MSRGVVKVKESYCITHGRMLPIQEFYESKNEWHLNKVMPYCKACCNNMFKKYLDQYRTLEAACYLTCAHNGIPFIKKVFEAFEDEINGYKNPSQYFGIYLKLLHKMSTKAEKQKWTDFGWSDADYRSMNTVLKSEESLKNQEKELGYLWGTDKDIDQLTYLEHRWEIYTKDKELEPYQEQLYRNLCCADLQIHENEDIETAMKIQRQCAKDLGLDQFDKQQRKTDVEQMLEYDIFLLEQNEPAEYYQNKEMYKDFRGIHKGWITEIMRPVINLITGSKEYGLDKDQRDEYLERTEDGDE